MGIDLSDAGRNRSLELPGDLAWEGTDLWSCLVTPGASGVATASINAEERFVVGIVSRRWLLWWPASRRYLVWWSRWRPASVSPVSCVMVSLAPRQRLAGISCDGLGGVSPVSGHSRVSTLFFLDQALSHVCEYCSKLLLSCA